MRWATLLAVLAGLALVNGGCVIVLGSCDLPKCKHVVEIDGDLYTVDLKTHRLQRIDAEWMTETESVTEPEAESGGD